MVFTPGQTLQKGKYTIEQELRGGLYDISYMTKRSDGDRWLIKVLNPDVLASLPNEAERDRLRTQFWREAVRLAKLSDTPHIVRVEAPFTEGELLCLPVECVDGRSLGKRSPIAGQAFSHQRFGYHQSIAAKPAPNAP